MNEAIKKYLEETMILVVGGEFRMGNAKNGMARPVHEVHLDSFWMNKYPVTQELYEWVMGKNPSYFRGSERPLEQVDWYDAIEFCNALSEIMGIERPYYRIDKEKQDPNNKNEYDSKKWLVKISENSKGYRLLTEAEWEYAARGGQEGKEDKFGYAGGNNLAEVGWYNENSHRETKEVGLKKANQLGLYDMGGNVDEWCWDWYGDYKEESQKNSGGAESGEYRAVRGGSWYDDVDSGRVAGRSGLNPGLRLDDTGFRISRVV